MAVPMDRRKIVFRWVLGDDIPLKGYGSALWVEFLMPWKVHHHGDADDSYIFRS